MAMSKILGWFEPTFGASIAASIRWWNEKKKKNYKTENAQNITLLSYNSLEISIGRGTEKI